MTKLEKEADTLCRYLSGRPVSRDLAQRYVQGLEAHGQPAPHQGSFWHVPASSGKLNDKPREAHRRLMLMAALLEADPSYNQLYRTRRGGLMAHVPIVGTLVSGFSRYLFIQMTLRWNRTR